MLGKIVFLKKEEILMSKNVKRILYVVGSIMISLGLLGICLCTASLYLGLPESNPSANAFHHLPYLLAYTIFIVVGIIMVFRQRLIEKMVFSG
jgi:hypothetical protein